MLFTSVSNKAPGECRLSAPGADRSATVCFSGRLRLLKLPVASTRCCFLVVLLLQEDAQRASRSLMTALERKMFFVYFPLCAEFPPELGATPSCLRWWTTVFAVAPIHLFTSSEPAANLMLIQSNTFSGDASSLPWLVTDACQERRYDSCTSWLVLHVLRGGVRDIAA